MSKELKEAVLAAIVVLIIIDVATTVLGLATIFHPSRDNPGPFLFCFGIALAVLIVLTLTQKIWHGGSNIHLVLRFFWVIAFSYDVYTSFRANVGIVSVGLRKLMEPIDILGEISQLRPEAVVAVCIGTLLISSAPILLPYVAGDHL